MANKKEEWQDPDSGYLNCIGVGDTYVKKQIARILNTNNISAQSIMYDPHNNGIDIWANDLKFKNKKRHKVNSEEKSIRNKDK